MAHNHAEEMTADMMEVDGVVGGESMHHQDSFEEQKQPLSWAGLWVSGCPDLQVSLALDFAFLPFSFPSFFLFHSFFLCASFPFSMTASKGRACVAVILSASLAAALWIRTTSHSFVKRKLCMSVEKSLSPERSRWIKYFV